MIRSMGFVRPVGASRLERRFIRANAEGEARFPRQIGLEPLFDQSNLLCRKARPFGRHPQIVIGGCQALEQDAPSDFSRNDGGIARFAAGQERFARVERKTALLLAARMTFAAMLLQQRRNIMGKIDLRGCTAGGQGKNQQGNQTLAHETGSWVTHFTIIVVLGDWPGRIEGRHNLIDIVDTSAPRAAADTL